MVDIPLSCKITGLSVIFELLTLPPLSLGLKVLQMLLRRWYALRLVFTILRNKV